MKSIALPALLAVLLSFPVHAEPPKTVDEIIALTVKQMAQRQTWSGTYGHLISDEGQPFPSEGTFVCKRPHQLRVETKAELLGTTMKMLLVVGTDQNLWLEASGRGGVSVMHGDLQKLPFSDIKSSVPQAIFVELMDPAPLWEKIRKLYTLEAGSNEMLAGQSMLVLHGTLKPEVVHELLTPELTQEVTGVTGLCRVLVGEQDGFIYLLERSLKYSTKNHQPSPLSEGEGIVFKDVIFNADVPDQKFVYRPAKGVAISELPLKDDPDDTGQRPAAAGKK